MALERMNLREKYDNDCLKWTRKSFSGTLINCWIRESTLYLTEEFDNWTRLASCRQNNRGISSRYYGRIHSTARQRSALADRGQFHAKIFTFHAGIIVARDRERTNSRLIGQRDFLAYSTRPDVSLYITDRSRLVTLPCRFIILWRKNAILRASVSAFFSGDEIWNLIAVRNLIYKNKHNDIEK